MDLIATEGANAETINIANPRSTVMTDIVHALERVLDTRAVFDILDKGARVPIDTGRISASIRRCAIAFGDAYLGNIVEKYYGGYGHEMDAFPAARSTLMDCLFAHPAGSCRARFSMYSAASSSRVFPRLAAIRVCSDEGKIGDISILSPCRFPRNSRASKYSVLTPNL